MRPRSNDKRTRCEIVPIVKAVASVLYDKEESITLDEIKEIQERVNQVHLSDALLDYLQEIIALSRNGVHFIHGLSTRSAQHWLR